MKQLHQDRETLLSEINDVNRNWRGIGVDKSIYYDLKSL